MKVFESNDNQGWDGGYKGDLAPPGHYAYIIELNCEEETQLYKGGVTLIR